ncbi:hypothetical protein Mal4_30990 [Maioricimonas rarisocia]|uniref:Response regulatory domain-containing protein n=1 Tax=Maioricimonas rarisocia TaxID=2528026 RepID=A0A517Z8I8_9PLAN|nr:HEAT repeat domain-containing protein [Maioricimonas rarisocia]QDU38769.1 hypothetical protein Mal4_30990 [Maioricimonas rarisocia]
MMQRHASWLLLITACLCLRTGLVQAQPPADDAADGTAQSPLASEPTNAQERVNAAMLMLRLARPDLARGYLQQILDNEPDDAQLLELRNEFGTATFLRLSRSDDLQPAAQELLNRINAAATRQLNDPAYVNGLIARLPVSPEEREKAIVELRFLRAYAVPPLLQRLTDPAAKIAPDLVVYTLTRLGTDAIPPLVGALQAGDDTIRAAAIEALGWIGDEQAVPYLWAQAANPNNGAGVQSSAYDALARILYGDAEKRNRLSPNGVTDRLLAEGMKLFAFEHEWPVNEAGQVVLWSWSDTDQTVVENLVSPASASLYRAEQFARDAAEIAAERAEPQVLLLATLLARDALVAGPNEPIAEGPGTAHNLALVAGPALCADVLALTLDTESYPAAAAVLRVLSQNGSRHLLASAEGRPSLLAAALDAPDPNVQFAAATAIMQLDPQEPFRGSRRVVEIFARNLNATPRKRTVVIDPNADRATTLASYLRDLGFEAGIARTGAEGFQLAAHRGDVELAVVHMNAIRWELSQTVANLKADARTAHVPVMIYGPAGLEGRTRWLASRNPGVTFLPEVNDSREVSRYLRPFLAQLPTQPLTPPQRDRRIRESAYWLRHIALGHRTRVFDLAPAEEALIDAAANPEVAGDAVIALAAIPRPSVQKYLADIALAPGAELPVRETAANQLAFHVQRYGVLLQQSRLQSLEAAWKSETEPALKTALAAVIGSTHPDSDAVRQQLLSFPPSPQPVP